MKTENKIIRSFIEEKEPKTIRGISKKIKSDYRITYTAAQRLLKRHVLLSKTIGKSTLCELNISYYGIEIYKAESERKQALLKNKSLMQLYKEIMEKTRTSFLIFLIFGSYAKGLENENSDIDIALAIGDMTDFFCHTNEINAD